MNSTGRFPIEIISLIAQHTKQSDLTSLVIGNKSIYATVNPILWRSLVIRNDDDFNTIVESLFASHQPLEQYVRRLCFEPTFRDKLDQELNDALLLLFIDQLPRLEELIITNGKCITDKSFQHIPRLCPHLTAITLHESSITTPKSIASLAQYGQNLRRLILESPSGLDLATTFTTLAACPMLQELTINSNGMEQFDIDLAVDTAVLAVAKLDRLTRLTLSMDPTRSNYFSQQVILKCIDAWPELTHFTLGYAHSVDDDMIKAFLSAEHRQQLQHFAIQSSEMTDQTFDTIARFVPDIITVGLTCCENLTYRGLGKFVRQCEQLEELDIRESGFEMDSHQQDIAWLFNEHTTLDTRLEKFDKDDLHDIRIGASGSDRYDSSCDGNNNNNYDDDSSCDDNNNNNNNNNNYDDSDDDITWL